MKRLIAVIIIILALAGYNVTLKAPGMIVVQGSIQLWPVTVINNSGMALVVVDELIDPEGSSSIVRILPSVIPNNQFTFQWPSNFEKPNARRITIYGRRYAVVPTNRIIIGNTSDATHPMVPSGDFIIIRTAWRNIAIADKLNPNQASGR
jgi:hypothetical protein